MSQRTKLNPRATPWSDQRLSGTNAHPTFSNLSHTFQSPGSSSLPTSGSTAEATTPNARGQQRWVSQDALIEEFYLGLQQRVSGSDSQAQGCAETGTPSMLLSTQPSFPKLTSPPGLALSQPGSDIPRLPGAVSPSADSKAASPTPLLVSTPTAETPKMSHQLQNKSVHTKPRQTPQRSTSFSRKKIAPWPSETETYEPSAEVSKSTMQAHLGGFQTQPGLVLPGEVYHSDRDTTPTSALKQINAETLTKLKCNRTAAVQAKFADLPTKVARPRTVAALQENPGQADFSTRVDKCQTQGAVKSKQNIPRVESNSWIQPKTKGANGSPQKFKNSGDKCSQSSIQQIVRTAWRLSFIVSSVSVFLIAVMAALVGNRSLLVIFLASLGIGLACLATIFRDEDPVSINATKCADEVEKLDVSSATKITSLMLRNLPCTLLKKDLSELLDSLGFAGTYDFIHVPGIFRSGQRKEMRGNLSYAFVNFIDEENATRFSQAFSGYKFERWGSQKVAEVRPARIQGLAAWRTQHGESAQLSILGNARPGALSPREAEACK